jgi:hypothetical protein
MVEEGVVEIEDHRLHRSGVPLRPAHTVDLACRVR